VDWRPVLLHQLIGTGGGRGQQVEEMVRQVGEVVRQVGELTHQVVRVVVR
jgi:hypothetical protein